MMSKFEEDFIGLSAGVFHDLGFSCVRIKIISDDNVLQVMFERNDVELVQVDDCVKLHKLLLKIILGSKYECYRLEVSSPGENRPITKLDDFEKFKGRNAKIVLDKFFIDNRFKSLKYCGNIVDVEGSDILLKVAMSDAEEILKIPYGWIRDAKVLLNDNH